MRCIQAVFSGGVGEREQQTLQHQNNVSARPYQIKLYSDVDVEMAQNDPGRLLEATW